MFPTSINGRIELSTLKPQHVGTVMRGIGEQLKAAKANRVSRNGGTISFEGGFFPVRFVSSWNVLGPVGHGEIGLFPGTPGEVRYRFSTVPLLIHALVMSLIASLIFGIGGGALDAMLVFLSAMGVLFGLNYLTAAFRLPAFVRRAATVHGEGPLACPKCGALYDPSDYLEDAPEKRCSACNGLLRS